LRKPFIIGIGGVHSGAGKTTLAAALLRHLVTSSLPGFRACRTWGAIKYTRTAFYSSVADDTAIIGQKGKDTRRLLDAGAEQVLWVQSPADGLEEVMPMAIDRLLHLDGILIEGNSAIEFIKPDIVIFISGESRNNIKPSAKAVLKLADIIIVPEKSVPDNSFETTGKAAIIETKDFPKGLDEKLIKDLINCMDTKIINREKIKQLLKERSVDSRIPCSTARKIAEELKVHYKEVGKAANELKIKIKNCELGCF
jgi:LAO/AO transport system kinase